MSRHSGYLDIQQGVVEMSHGSGGRAMAQLIDVLFVPDPLKAWLRQGHEAAALPLAARGLVLSTHAPLLSPLFFPGGETLALCLHGPH